VALDVAVAGKAIYLETQYVFDISARHVHVKFTRAGDTVNNHTHLPIRTCSVNHSGDLF
jgi:hypothetical protein